MFIDIYTHIFPGDFFDHMSKAAPRLENIGKRMKAVTELHDLDARFRTMDRLGDYRQIISLPNPPIEEITDPALGPQLARVANDAMAELVRRHPDRFPAFVAAMSMHNMEETMTELHRAIGELGARGVQIFTHIAGRPLDDPEFAPLFAAMAEYDLPIWMHPTRTAAVTDYGGEERSRFEMWWCFGWPYDTSVAMARLVFSGLFDRHPGIKILTHHLGGMIPFFEGRIDDGMAGLGSRTTDEDYSGVLSGLKKPHSEYFKMFYGDTALFGARGYNGTKCGLEYFGADHVAFASDAPFGPIADTLEVINRLEIEGADQKKILSDTAGSLMNMSFD